MPCWRWPAARQQPACPTNGATSPRRPGGGELAELFATGRGGGAARSGQPRHSSARRPASPEPRALAVLRCRAPGRWDEGRVAAQRALTRRGAVDDKSSRLRSAGTPGAVVRTSMHEPLLRDDLPSDPTGSRATRTQPARRFSLGEPTTPCGGRRGCGPRTRRPAAHRCPQPGLGLQWFGLRGRGKRKRRNASCMACGARVSAGSLGTAHTRVPRLVSVARPERMAAEPATARGRDSA